MTSVLTHPCISLQDAAYVVVSPSDGIAEGEDQDDNNPAEWRDGGACKPEVPVSASAMADPQPELWPNYRAQNATCVS